MLAETFPGLGIGFAGVALAFGLTVVTMACAIGLWAGGRFEAGKLRPYIVAQVLGAVIAGGKAGFDVTTGFASNRCAEHAPGKYSMIAVLLTEVVMTMMFLIIIMGSTDKRAPQGFAPLAIVLTIGLAIWPGADADSPD